MKKPENMVMVIFGATGDLAYRKLIPALYALHKQNMLPENFHILGIGRGDNTNNSFRSRMTKGISLFQETKDSNLSSIDSFISKLSYFRMNMDLSEDYQSLKTHLKHIDKTIGTDGNYMFYLAMIPGMFSVISDHLGKAGLNSESSGYKKLIVEKPFGYDLKSSHELNLKLHHEFDETQIYRIDHYLGKETVQNLLVMRFSNGIFEPLWNRNYIHHIEITSAENIGVEGRGAYYDKSGALRDMLQNHLLQMVGLVSMEPPTSMEADAIRNETMKVFQSLRPLTQEDVTQNVIRGQYAESKVGGKNIPGYREEEGVDPYHGPRHLWP